ncbi:DNA pilot protein [Microvirus sp.]|nr:DNA pilot protein [Microvirus sp.]
MIYKVFNKLAHDNRKCGPLTMAGASVIGSGISAVGNALGGIFSSQSNKKLMREQMRWQESMYARQLQDARDNWKMQNEYNSPANQRKLLEEAGYNPAMMGADLQSASSADNIAMGNVPSAPSYSMTPNYIADTVNSATQAFSTLVAAHATQQNADTNAKNADTNAKNAGINQQNADTNSALAYHQNALTRQNIQLAAQENAFKSEFMQNQINQMRANTNLVRVQTGIAAITKEWLPYEKSMQLSKLSADIDNVLEDVKLKKVSIKVGEAQVQQLLNSAALLLSQAKTANALRPSQVSASETHASNLKKGISDTFQSDKWLAPVSISANGSLNVYGGSAGTSVNVPRGVVTDGVDAILKVADRIKKKVTAPPQHFDTSQLTQPGMMSQ